MSIETSRAPHLPFARRGGDQRRWRGLAGCALAALVAATTAGCTFNRLQINDAGLPGKAAQIRPGVTTAEEMEALIGPATSITPIGRDLLYAYAFGDSKSAGLSLILFNVSKTNTGIDTALFLVGPDEVVQKVYVGRNAEDLPWQWWAFGD